MLGHLGLGFIAMWRLWWVVDGREARRGMCRVDRASRLGFGGAGVCTSDGASNIKLAAINGGWAVMTALSSQRGHGLKRHGDG